MLSACPHKSTLPSALLLCGKVHLLPQMTSAVKQKAGSSGEAAQDTGPYNFERNSSLTMPLKQHTIIGRISPGSYATSLRRIQRHVQRSPYPCLPTFMGALSVLPIVVAHLPTV